MNEAYLDNASTSFPKPETVAKEMIHFINDIGCNVNRGGYQSAYNASSVVFETRELIKDLFNAPHSQNVIFTPNITYSLNIIIKGYLKSGDHVLVSSMEHNAMMRPLLQLTKEGVTFDRIPCNDKGELMVDEIKPLIKSNTKAIFILHSSNVCGTVMPIQKIGEICKQHNLRFIVDTAQSAGVIPIDMEKMHIDALAFTGHKSLMGPQGIGGFIVTDSFSSEITPLISGGTGSISDTEDVPDFLPDKFEPGTPNLPGIYGLNAGLRYLKDIGIDNVHKHEMKLTQYMLSKLMNFQNDLKIIGKQDIIDRTAVISVDFKEKDNAEISFLLDHEYNIMTRCGMHCAPNAHKTLNTFPQGTVRFSLGYFNTFEDIDYAINALGAILK